MIATERQCAYLTALSGKVERMRYARHDLADLPQNRDWNRERERGMTSRDASAWIDAYRAILGGASPRCVILNTRQF